MNSVVLLSYETESPWTSCSLLLSEIEHTYRLAYGEKLLTIKIKENDPEDKKRVIKEIAQISPDIVVFSDHRMTILASWIKEIKLLVRPDHRIHWGIHTYGCFMGRAKEWIDLCEAARNDSVSFLCASNAQQAAAAQLFKNSSCVKLFRIPYMGKHPINHERRTELRKKFNLKNDDIALIYAGRISYQKNVHHLIKLIQDYQRNTSQKLKLFICGGPDDVNPREAPHAYYLNYGMELFLEALQAANENQPLINYLGLLSHPDLIDHFQAMDGSISLSTLEGEDYGRSLVESLSCGLPVIATQWGGHKDLSILPQVKIIPILLENETLKLDIDELYQALNQLSNHLDKKKNQEKFEQHFDPKLAAKGLVAHYQNHQSTGGFTKNALIHVSKLETGWKTKEFFVNYEKVLQSYWS